MTDWRGLAERLYHQLSVYGEQGDQLQPLLDEVEAALSVEPELRCKVCGQERFDCVMDALHRFVAEETGDAGPERRSDD
jgi:hypothetical protein